MSDNGTTGHTITGFEKDTVQGMFEQYYLDYSSYVILDRAVPNIEDGLKPVQRRILHALKEMDDGRYNKVANVIGTCMRYHPHGDASIGEALINLGQKDLLIDTQGNWGNILTGDSAAAPRYIEARLSPFANDVVFESKLTKWQLSYDGRSKEPIYLPIKFPLLLVQGAEGIAVGLSTKILPHNFQEAIEACISAIRNEKFRLLPDFPTAGLADFGEYEDGRRGGRVKVRAKISKVNDKTLKISEIPFSTTTSSLIDSIVSANDKGKIKIKKVEDNTAKNVEILVHLTPNSSAEKTIEALFAFTNCEISIAPNCCVIKDDKPVFIGVTELVQYSAQRTKEILGQGLEIRIGELKEKILFSSLEAIFIDKKIYQSIENCTSWEAVLTTIDTKLQPYKKHFYREITRDDIIRLTEIKIKRISKYDKKKADEILKNLEEELTEVEKNLKQLTRYTISYFKRLLKEYGKNFPRRTSIKGFKTVDKTKVAAKSLRMYCNAKDGFVGTSLRREEFLFECSAMDEVIAFTRDAILKVAKVGDKIFIGKGILYASLYTRGDQDTVYNIIYRDKKSGAYLLKRFPVPAVTRDREYDLTKGAGGRIVYFSVTHKDHEPEEIQIKLRPAPRLRKLDLKIDLNEYSVSTRDAKGQVITKHAIAKIENLGDDSTEE